MTTYPIVGYRHRWPAKAILDVLSTGTWLSIRAEPTNAVDPNAIQILLDKNILSKAAITVLKHEHDVNWLTLPQEVHLGYIPAPLAALMRAEGFTSAIGTFAVGANGGPKVAIGEE